MNSAAVLDTNALVDLISCHDVVNAVTRGERDAFFRFERAAFALRMAIHFHETRATTLTARREAFDITVKQVPPDVNDVKSWYVRTWFRFVQPKLLHHWTITTAAIGGSGNAIDDGLVELAHRLRCPLISNEGIGPDGPTRNDRIRRHAAKLRVRVMTTAEFSRSTKLSRTRIKRYIRAFQTLGPRFQRGHRLYNDVQRFLGDVFDYHQKLLYGTEPDAIGERMERMMAERQ